MSRFYPPLAKAAITSIRTIQRISVEDSDYLDDPECPYDPEIKEWLRLVIAPVGVGGSEKIEDLETEATNLYFFLKSLKPTTNVISKDAFDYAKVATSLLDKLLTVVERAQKVKEVGDFKKKVIDFMADILSPEQRTLFMDRVANDIS